MELMSSGIYSQFAWISWTEESWALYDFRITAECLSSHYSCENDTRSRVEVEAAAGGHDLDLAVILVVLRERYNRRPSNPCLVFSLLSASRPLSLPALRAYLLTISIPAHPCLFITQFSFSYLLLPLYPSILYTIWQLVSFLESLFPKLLRTHNKR